jgi:MFS family permease
MFGLGALPAGRLGDLWGRRRMMIIFFAGLGASAMLVAAAKGPLSLAVALTVMGIFTAIYHPVGIPMIVQNAKNPGFTIGVNGLAGNLGIAFAALLTGFLVKYAGWRMAFIVPGASSRVGGALRRARGGGSCGAGSGNGPAVSLRPRRCAACS